MSSPHTIIRADALSEGSRQLGSPWRHTPITVQATSHAAEVQNNSVCSGRGVHTVIMISRKPTVTSSNVTHSRRPNLNGSLGRSGAGKPSLIIRESCSDIEIKDPRLQKLFTTSSMQMSSSEEPPEKNFPAPGRDTGLNPAAPQASTSTPHSTFASNMLPYTPAGGVQAGTGPWRERLCLLARWTS